MPAVNDLNAGQALELSYDGIAAITPEVKITADMRGIQSVAANGAYVFGTGGYVPNELDITSYVLNKHVVLKSSIPFLPTNGNPVDNKGDVQIQVSNTIRYLGALQDEAIFDPDNIQNAEVVINANCGSMDALPLYKGRVIRSPKEEEGKTTFSTKAIMWDIIDIEARAEVAVGGSVSTFYYLNENGTIVNFPYSPTARSITFYHGITVFDERGDLKSSVTNSKAEEIGIRRVDFVSADNEAPQLGKYTIRFTTNEDYTLTHPDREQFTGRTDQTLESGYVRILPSYWNVIGEPADAEISFYCSYTAKGNPITIVKNLLHKGLADAWGSDPDEVAALDVDWDIFTKYETYFNGKNVYVTETNLDNSVFDPYQGGKPLRIKDFCQRILDHVGAQLTFNSEGKVSMNCDWYLLPNEFVPTYQTAHLASGVGNTRKAAHSISASGPKYNRLVVKYGQNIITKDYGGTTTFVVADDTKFSTLRVSFPYYKATKNDHDVSALNCTLWEIVKTADIVLKMSLKPNWGLPVAVGDKLEVDLTTQPVLPNAVTQKGQYWQMHSVTKRIGGVVDVEAHMVPEHGVPLLLCDWTLCTDSLGTQAPVIPEPNAAFTYTFPFELA